MPNLIQKIKQIEASHIPLTLPSEVTIELDKIIEAAEHQAEKIYRK